MPVLTGLAPLSYFDGIVITNKLGDVNLKAVAGKTSYTSPQSG